MFQLIPAQFCCLLAQILLMMNITMNIEDCDIKIDFDSIRTPLIEVASAGHVNIVSCLIIHKADVVILDLHRIT